VPEEDAGDLPIQGCIESGRACAGMQGHEMGSREALPQDARIATWSLPPFPSGGLLLLEQGAREELPSYRDRGKISPSCTHIQGKGQSLPRSLAMAGRAERVNDFEPKGGLISGSDPTAMENRRGHGNRCAFSAATWKTLRVSHSGSYVHNDSVAPENADKLFDFRCCAALAIDGREHCCGAALRSDAKDLCGWAVAQSDYSNFVIQIRTSMNLRLRPKSSGGSRGHLP